MKNLFIAGCVAASISAFAQAPAPAPKAATPAPAPMAATPAPAPSMAAAAPAPAMDWTKVGAPSRKPTDEKKTKKEVEEFFKQGDLAESKHDEAAMLAMNDFPLYMATDDSAGMPSGSMVTKEQYLAMMSGMAGMPKDLKTTHKRTLSVISDSLVNVVDDFTMTEGKIKANGRNMALVVKIDGNWKWKSMVEAGWGHMMANEAKTASAPAPTMAPAPAAKTPASAPAPAPAAAGSAPAPAPKK